MFIQGFKEEIMRSFVDLASARDILFIRAINKSNLQPDSIYKEVGDIAATVYFYVGDIGDQFISAQVPKTFLSSWGLTESEVYNIAKENSRKLFSVSYYDILNPWNEGIDLFSSECELSELMNIPNCISNSIRTNGASAMFWSNVTERIAELLDGSYFIVFTSLHEVMIHKDDCNEGNKEMLKNILEGMIEAGVPDEDLLSRNIFYYNIYTKEITVVR